ncbi:Chromosomal replication initiator protein DnaA [hydrothermal vent metagenome]|uniref:Chromosomal replication initiator protein DnaA n=1 Tax=hydrothermal vent metagenome TaxID=652676 RepID=A0A3B1CK69_9ZZZZ
MSEKDPQSRQLILDFPVSPDFNFSNFVRSEGSEFAWQAARQVSSSIDLPYHSLYFYGDRNLGKTHLLMAIGNAITENFPDKKIIFINGREFVRKFSENNAHEITKVINPLLSTDYFLMDDVDLISGKPSVQEKLYHIYNTLLENNKTSIFTGRDRPEKLVAMEPYLKSRFQWGMTAEIKPIDDGTTAKIIAKLAKDVGLSIPQKIIDFLLTHIPRDFISIKTAVEKINKESFARKRKVTLPLAKAALNLP